MKVAQVLDTSSRLAGGLFESVKGLARTMIDAGHDVVVLSGTDPWTEADLPSWAPARPVAVPSGGVTGSILARPLAQAITAADPDLVHLHGIWGVAARATAAWARRTGRPVAISPRGMMDPWALARSRRKKQISRLVWEGPLIRNAAFLHALNEEEAAAIRATGFAGRIVLSPNGVALPPEPARPAASDARTLLFLARIHPKKGVEELVRAWALVPVEARRGWRLCAAGWDEVGMIAELAALASSLGVGDSVTFPGPVFGPDKVTAFRSASAFILPSYSEGLPMGVLEAWSYGLPVFMTAACNLPRGFAEGAAFEIATDPTAMAQVLTARLMDPAGLAAAGRTGRALVERAYGWQAIGREMWAAYAVAVAG